MNFVSGLGDSLPPERATKIFRELATISTVLADWCNENKELLR